MVGSSVDLDNGTAFQVGKVGVVWSDLVLANERVGDVESLPEGEETFFDVGGWRGPGLCGHGEEDTFLRLIIFPAVRPICEGRAVWAERWWCVRERGGEGGNRRMMVAPLVTS